MNNEERLEKIESLILDRLLYLIDDHDYTEGECRRIESLSKAYDVLFNKPTIVINTQDADDFKLGGSL